MDLIPAIDLIDGKCVRLTQGDFSRQKTYHENPLEVAKMFEAHGVRRLHLVDLDGARQKRIINHRVLEAIATKTALVVDFGGGLQSNEDLEIAFSSGAAMVTGGSIAVKNRPLFASWLATYGPDRIILGADAKDGRIAVSGWQDTTELEVIAFVQDFQKIGVSQVICTDIAKDGLLAGPSFALYEKMLSDCPDLKLIASGGVTTVADLHRLSEMNLDGAIIGKALYEGTITLQEVAHFAL